MAPPRRSGALIAVVLVLDLALACAGATLLFKGLAKPKAADAKPAKTEPHAQTTAAPAPAPVATAPTPAAAPVEPPPPPEPADKTVARDPKKKPAAKAEGKTEAKKTATAPVDPYAGGGAPAPGPDRTDEIEIHARDSFGSFRRCFEDAIHGGPIHGDIRIKFVVEADGHVERSSPAENTTGSDVLASCLAETIHSWTFAPHSGAASSYERPFHYP